MGPKLNALCLEDLEITEEAEQQSEVIEIFFDREASEISDDEMPDLQESNSSDDSDDEEEIRQWRGRRQMGITKMQARQNERSGDSASSSSSSCPVGQQNSAPSSPLIYPSIKHNKTDDYGARFAARSGESFRETRERSAASIAQMRPADFNGEREQKRRNSNTWTRPSKSITRNRDNSIFTTVSIFVCHWH